MYLQKGISIKTSEKKKSVDVSHRYGSEVPDPHPDPTKISRIRHTAIYVPAVFCRCHPVELYNFSWCFHVPVRYFRETAFSSVNFYVLQTFSISLVGNDITTTWVAVSKLKPATIDMVYHHARCFFSSFICLPVPYLHPSFFFLKKNSVVPDPYISYGSGSEDS
jgi:hypothetical protein